MKTITRARKVFLITLGDIDRETVFDAQVQQLSEDIFNLTRNLYTYTFPFRYGTRKIMTNDELMQEFDIAQEILNYTCDEVWVLGDDKPDSSMGGTNAFWIGSNPVRIFENIHRRFAFMRFGQEPLLKTYARRVENTMYRLYAGYPPAKNVWEKFIRNDRTHPEHASCGTVLYPPNGIFEGYDSKISFLSDADDWLNSYPNFKDRVRYMDASEWGGTEEGYLRWWLRHIPHGEHKTDGIHENWWHYVMNLDLIK